MTSVASLILLCLFPTSAFAAGDLGGATLGGLWALPFAGMLLSIALGPVLFPHFWERHWADTLESMAVFLLPIGIALAGSVIAQVEFRNNAWKQTHTQPQTFTTVFFAKLAVILVMLVQFFVLFNVGVYLSAVLPGLFFAAPYPPEPLPLLFFLRESASYFVACLPIVALQYLLSLQFRNFLVPLGAGIGLWILSIAVLPWEYGHLFPYAYTGLHYLHSVGRYTRDIPLLPLAAGYFVIFTAISYILYVTKKEKG